MTTTVLAASDIVSSSHTLYLVLASVGVSAALATAIVKGLKQTWKVGVGAGIGAFFGCIALAIGIANAVGLFSIGDNEFQKDTGIHHNQIRLPGGYGQ